MGSVKTIYNKYSALRSPKLKIGDHDIKAEKPKILEKTGKFIAPIGKKDCSSNKVPEPQCPARIIEDVNGELI